jgi:hypothetical protein
MIAAKPGKTNRMPATPAGMYLVRCSPCADQTEEQVTRSWEF